MRKKEFHELNRIVAEYVLANQLCYESQQHYRRHVDRYIAWCDVDPENRQFLDAATVNQFLVELESEIGPATVNSHRQSIIALLRFDTDEFEPLPRTSKIRRQREPEKIKPAFTLDEIRTLIAKAPLYHPVTQRTYGRGLAGDVKPRYRPDGVSWSVWWEAFVRAAYSSGQYFADLRRVRWEDVGADGVVNIARKKTGRLLTFELDELAIVACRRIGHAELVLPWAFNIDTYFSREFRKFCEFCGVRALGAKAIRRCAITYVFIEQGEGAARMLAGHKNFDTTSKHYIDWTVARRPVVRPPAL